MTDMLSNIMKINKNPETLFTIQNVTYKHILSIEQLEISKGVTCILGESGAGKSTFLKLLNNLISPDQGQIIFKNQVLESMDPLDLRQRIVMLMQSPVIFSGTVRDNLLFGLRVAEKNMAHDNKLLDILKWLELEKISLDADAVLLSGGEKQRICMGRLTLMDPEVFLLDEPSAALDEKNQELIINRITQHARDNDRDLIMILHSEQIGRKYSDCLIHFKKDFSIVKEVL
ncbi:ABC transporter ATP-binding protein [Desulfitibacter alkalitolerans]|uniref:ABC transporter ATP-binding protein n=1 Tax=Desulfitibacter alkalitolerans TaxID=264641 RepID=UPI000683F1B7|nr:ATP-binding cassette domain-containing protein [Desulfitibacter alkalitolerans]